MDYQLIFNMIVSAFMGIMAYKVSKLERDVEALKMVTIAIADIIGINYKKDESDNEDNDNSKKEVKNNG